METFNFIISALSNRISLICLPPRGIASFRWLHAKKSTRVRSTEDQPLNAPPRTASTCRAGSVLSRAKASGLRPWRSERWHLTGAYGFFKCRALYTSVLQNECLVDNMYISMLAERPQIWVSTQQCSSTATTTNVLLSVIQHDKHTNGVPIHLNRLKHCFMYMAMGIAKAW